MPRFVLILLLLYPIAPLGAQIQTFKKRHGTSGNDEAVFVEVLPDNSFIVAGSSAGGGLGGQDAMLVKFNEDGTVAWSKAYGGSGSDFFMKIIACSDGNYIALGETNSFGAGNTDIYVVKFDGGGNVVWQRTLGGGSVETARGVCEVSDGYIITGGTQSFGNGFWDIYVSKLDPDGATVWSRAWGGGGGDIAGDPLPGSNGDIWVAGFIFIGGGNHDGILMRLNAGGNLQSAIRVGASGNESLSRLIPGGPGIAGSGATWTYSGNSQLQPWILGFNTSGGLAWAKRYLIPTGNYQIDAEACPDGGFVFTPLNINNDTGDAYLVKTDGNGNITWAKAHAFNGNGRTYHARPTPDGGFVAVGYCTGSGRDMFILKTDAAGNVANCCPNDAPVTAAAVSPATPGTMPGSNSGPVAGTPAGQEASPALNETNLCNGPACCLTDAGAMLGQTLHACINLPATLTHDGNEILEPGDLLQFILFTNPGNPLNSIVTVGNLPEFTFNPATMQTGVVYFVAAIAGNNTGGNVDLNDPCLDISNAVQLIWHPLPEVVFSANNYDVCAGGCQTITATFSGTAPFTLTYATPGGVPTTQVFAGATGAFQICPPPNTPAGSFSVQATALVDGYCSCN